MLNLLRSSIGFGIRKYQGHPDPWRWWGLAVELQTVTLGHVFQNPCILWMGCPAVQVLLWKSAIRQPKALMPTGASEVEGLHLWADANCLQQPDHVARTVVEGGVSVVGPVPHVSWSAEPGVPCHYSDDTRSLKPGWLLPVLQSPFCLWPKQLTRHNFFVFLLTNKQLISQAKQTYC